ncbi:MAG: HEAT repeat domain-containing protein [Candidatus Neomarinimicrobiota bacterium]
MEYLTPEFEEQSQPRQWKEHDGAFDQAVEQFGSIDSDDRRWAIYDLEEYTPTLTVDLMVRAIQDEHRAVREAAAEVLRNNPAEICATKLVPLLGGPRIEVRNIVASVLTSLGDGAVDALNHALFHENEDVRKFGADILGLNGSHEAVAELCKACYDPVENVAVSAVEALGKIRSGDALPTLYDVFEKEIYLRKEAVEAIGMIGDASAVAFLESRLDTDDPLELYSILDALGNIGAAGIVDRLTDLLSNIDGPLREQTFWTILKIGRINETNVLNGITLPPELFKNGFGLNNEQLGYLDYQLSLKPNRQVLQTFYQRKDQLPVGLLVTLVKSTPPEAHFEEAVLNLTEHADDWLAYSATEALARFDSPAVKSAIMKKLNEGRSLAVIAAIKLAVQLDIDEARAAIAKLVESDDEDISTAARQALGE